METLITGYHYDANKKYIGIYKFPKNLDKEEVHLPPNTTLVPVPDDVSDKEDIIWDGEKWDLVDKEIAAINNSDLIIPKPFQIPTLLPEPVVS